jgi:PP-loop superfamily ATP-utilizing enzyme
MLEANLLKIIHPYRSALVCSSGGSDSSAVVTVCGVAYVFFLGVYCVNECE